MIESQVNASSLAASHLKDSRPAREEIEGIVNVLTRFDHGLKVGLFYFRSEKVTAIL